MNDFVRPSDAYRMKPSVSRLAAIECNNMSGTNPSRTGLRRPKNRTIRRNSASFLMRLLLAVLGSSASGAHAQTEQSPRALIRYLTYQSDRPDQHGMLKGSSGIFSCGPALAEARDHRALTRSLVRMGTSAVPAIEEAINSFEALGENSEIWSQAGWVLLAYAQIEGPAAFPRLHRLIGNPKLGAYAFGVDNSIALALGLTSYVSSFRRTGRPIQHQCRLPGSDAVSFGPKPCKLPSREVPIESFHCDRGEEPRDALDRMILAWETDDRPSLEAALGPTAESALTQLLKDTTWAAMRSALWSGRPKTNVDVGYRFDVPGRWSESEGTLEDERLAGNPQGNYNHPEIKTSLTTRSGNTCGETRLTVFSTPHTPWPEGRRRYSVDNSDLGNLLQRIASCAALP
jgi:hypothetical protein